MIWDDVDFNNETLWYDKRENALIKDKKTVIKVHNEKGEYKKSAIIPTNYYPLNDDMEIFNIRNTEEIKDEKVLEIFDSIEYKIGRCYTNTKELSTALRKAGYDAKTYCGWLCVSENQFPIHHCWTVLGNSILDLSDDLTIFMYMNHSEMEKDISLDKSREVLADFYYKARKFKNRERCYPVGIPTPTYLYIGSECDPMNGISIYNNLIDEFPNHECQRNCNSKGQNKTQEYIKEYAKKNI